MLSYTRDLVVNWGESDPFGLVYFPRILSWFNDTEHELFAKLGHPVNKMINKSRSAFVMGTIHFKFVGPAAYGDRVRSTITVEEITKSKIIWKCLAINLDTDTKMTEGLATRVYAKILEDGNLKAQIIPDEIRDLLLTDESDQT